MIRIFPNEEFKEFDPGYKSKFHYAISNYGRLVSYMEKFEDGHLIKGGMNQGYKTFCYKFTRDNKPVYRYLYFHNLVAENFIEKTSADQTYVLCLDRNRGNLYVDNLKWATRQEMLEHRRKYPHVIEARKKLDELNRQRDGHKLSSTTVKLIKKKLLDPNRKTRMKIIAKQFGVSEMTLTRIKSGENWGHITID